MKKFTTAYIPDSQNGGYICFEQTSNLTYSQYESQNPKHTHTFSGNATKSHYISNLPLINFSETALIREYEEKIRQARTTDEIRDLLSNFTTIRERTKHAILTVANSINTDTLPLAALAKKKAGEIALGFTT